MFLIVDGDWLSPISKIFGIIMNSIFVVLEKKGIQNGAIGIAIIIFTLTTRLILYPMQLINKSLQNL